MMSFFVKAAVEALKLVPQVNVEVRGTDIVYRNYYDIGVAVGGGKGLVVPIIRSAERLSFAEIEQTIADFKRAQAASSSSPSSRAARSRSRTAASTVPCSRRPSSIHRKAEFSVCTPSRSGPSRVKVRSSCGP